MNQPTSRDRPQPASAGEQLRRQLDAAGDAARPAELRADTRQGQLDCSLAGAEKIGCSVDKIGVRSDTLRAAGSADIRRIGQRIAERVTYLLEPLSVMEVDDPSSTAILRSAPAWREDQVREYYEAQVAPQGMTLQRFRKEPDQPRSLVPIELTRRALERLADDLADAAG